MKKKPGGQEKAISENGKQGCTHQRIVDVHVDASGRRTENVVCRECGAVIPEPLKNPSQETLFSPAAGRGTVMSSTKSDAVCFHQRVVSEVRDAHGQRTGLLVCRECRAVFPSALQSPA
jgi:ribosomal protein L40E